MLATKTLAAIEAGIRRDGGAAFRVALGKALPECSDAYAPQENDFRSHLGASLIGHECARYLWYTFHWAFKGDPEPRIRVLWNRGHLEEGRFIALLQQAGITVFQHDQNGKQFRIHGVQGHYGGSCDGVLTNVPDVPASAAVLGEFKTHNDKSFSLLVADGVKASKYQHYAQMVAYMEKLGLAAALYLAVNKDNERLYAEIVTADNSLARRLEQRAEMIIHAEVPPQRISNRASWYKCSYCDAKNVCHNGKLPERNCRTCANAVVALEGQWICKLANFAIPKEVQLTGCVSYETLPVLAAGA